MPSIEMPRGLSRGEQRLAVSVHSTRSTASTEMGTTAMLVPLRPMMVTGVTTQRPIMMRPELE
jgi:hypothetical protein